MNGRSKLTYSAALMIVLILIGPMFVQTAQAPPEQHDPDWYVTAYGVLDSDTYELYPYNKTSLNVGFSKFGELIDGETNTGLEYADPTDPRDPFTALDKRYWTDGWHINISYTRVKARRVWAFAMFADLGEWGYGWNTGLLAPMEGIGGRQTSGYAESVGPVVLYDGPRRFVAQSTTHIFESETKVVELVDVVITMVFNKVKKTVVLLKDVKCTADDPKITTPLCIEFSDRSEWDFGPEPEYKSFAHFFTKEDWGARDTVYGEDWHEFEIDPNYAVAQIISNDTIPKFVGFAAYWPHPEDWTVNGGGVLFTSLPDWMDRPEDNDLPSEPDIPFVIGEWEFALDTDAATEVPPQFRGVTAYGITDWHDASDWDAWWDYDYEWAYDDDELDREVKFQLDEVFNPWDLRQAVGMWTGGELMRPGKHTERHVEFFEGDDETTVFHLPEQIVANYSPWLGWDEYCSFSEKVLVDGELQIPYRANSTFYNATDKEFQQYYDYNLTSQYWINETLATGPATIKAGTTYDLLYGRIWVGSEVVEIIENKTKFIRRPGYDIDYGHGKVYMAEKVELEFANQTLQIRYYPEYNATKVIFKEPPAEGAEIKVLYSVWRFVWKTDVFKYGVDGVMCEHDVNGLRPDFMHEVFFLRHRPVVPDYFRLFSIYYGGPENHTEAEVYVPFPELMPGYPGPRWRPGWYPLENFTRWGVIEEFGIVFVEGLWPDAVFKVTYLTSPGRYEWNVVGTKSAAVDSAGATMVSEGFREWKNMDVKLSALELEETLYGPETPYLLSGTGRDREDYKDTEDRVHLKDDWCKTLPVSSSNLIVVGGPFPNTMADYFNDFTDAFVKSTLGRGFYSPACWLGNFYKNTEDTGYAIISTYKDINGTIGFIVYGWSGQDTYYASYVLQHGLLDLLQWIQPGVTTLVLEFDYDEHPSEEGFCTVVEALGTISECQGFGWMFDGDTADFTIKILKNSVSSDYLDFHVTVKDGWIVAFDIIRPNYIHIDWKTHFKPEEARLGCEAVD